MKRLFLALPSLLFAVMVSGQEAPQYWHGVERTLRYTPDGEDFVITNGDKRFTRALYGTNTAFRVETSDFPEFGMYMSRLGGSVYMALAAGEKAKWVRDAEYIESRYRPGSRIYTVRDKEMLGGGELRITALALSDADGFIVRVEPIGVPDNVDVVWIYGGANNERFSREGDMGADPADSFYIKARRAEGNIFKIEGNGFDIYYGAGMRVASDDEAYENDATKSAAEIERGEIARQPMTITGTFPQGAVLSTVDAAQIDSRPEALIGSKGGNAPLLMARYPAGSEATYFEMHNPATRDKASARELASMFEKAEEFRSSIAGRITINTPDPYFNTLGGAISIAGDGVWESPVYRHGAIGWRIPLPGWRAGYTGDFLGWHDRARTHFDAYAASQMTAPADKPVIMDTVLNLARVAKVLGTPMYSSGYISRNPGNNTQMHHYDMNLVYIDALLWHLNWTGDMEYARRMWPVIERHLAWEKLNFDADGDGLYDAYCCIWASDALQYSGGGVTHSSSYNYRGNKMAAEIAEKIGKDPAPYRAEAEKILRAMNEKLWLKDKGWWAEYVEFLGDRNVHPSAAVWTVYHAVDSDVSPDNFQAYQAARYIDTHTPHIPVLAKGLDETDNYVVSTTTWGPYHWSINNVAFAESTHTALALWQAGEFDKAFKLFKGTVLDAMYIGSSPGNFGQVSFYDATRGETYRDFSDPVGIASRAIMQGLFGIYPDAMNGRMVLKPGYPSGWDHASVSTPDHSFSFVRSGSKDTYVYEQNMPSKLNVVLRIPALAGKASVRVNGRRAEGKFVQHVGKPMFEVECGNGAKNEIVVTWQGKAIENTASYPAVVYSGENVTVKLARGQKLMDVSDPQGVFAGVSKEPASFSGSVDGTLGHRTLFALVRQGDASWYMPVEMEVRRPVEIISGVNESPNPEFAIRNNTGGEISVDYTVNGSPANSLKLSAGATVKAEAAGGVMGANKVVVTMNGRKVAEKNVMNWVVQNPASTDYETVDMSPVLNDKVTQIFKNKYMSPRSPYGTLQIPVQGIGEWCIPDMTADINDSGFRAAISDGVFRTAVGVPFASQADPQKNNIAYTSMWENYPREVSVPLSGRASHAYLLMAGSTNHMQADFVNATVTVTYTDGTEEKLELVNPDNWAPIERDHYFDGYAYRTNQPRFWRVTLLGGVTTRDVTKDLRIRNSTTKEIRGGAANILDLPLDSGKELKELTLRTEALEVVVGLMGVTLVR